MLVRIPERQLHLLELRYIRGVREGHLVLGQLRCVRWLLRCMAIPRRLVWEFLARVLMKLGIETGLGEAI